MADRDPSRYGPTVAPTTARALAERLPQSVAAAVLELLTGDLLVSPYRVGKPLQRELARVWSVRRGTYRILYEIDDVERVVRVLDVSHRGDVYRRK